MDRRNEDREYRGERLIIDPCCGFSLPSPDIFVPVSCASLLLARIALV